MMIIYNGGEGNAGDTVMTQRRKHNFFRSVYEGNRSSEAETKVHAPGRDRAKHRSRQPTEAQM